MAAKVLNIEVGKRIVKVCVSEKKGKSFSVSDSFYFATPEGSVLDGQVISEIALGDRLKDELTTRNIKVTDVFFSVASSKIASREVTLPSAKDEQIKNIIKTNVADYFPVDVTKYAIDSVILERGDEEVRALVVAVPSVIVDSYISLADYCGLVVNAVDFCPNSQYQILKGIKSGEEDMVDMFITIDPDNASVIFSENGNMLMQRAIPIGGDEMICRFMAMRDMPTEDYITALDMLNNLVTNIGEESEDEEEDDLAECMMKLVNGISRSLDFFRGNVADKVVTRVVLMGSCCHLSGLRQKIQERVAIDTVCLEDVPDIQSLANSISDISVFIGCLGARIAPMNFMPQEYLAKNGVGDSKNSINQRYGSLILIIACVVSVLLVGSTAIRYFVNKKNLSDVEKGIAQYQYAEEEYYAYLNYTQGDDNLQKFVSGATETNNAKLKAFFEELEDKMPSSILLLSANCNEQGVSMNVTVADYNSAAVAIRQLRSFESVDVIKVSALSQGDGLVAFSMNCTYVVPEPETQPAPAETTAEAAQ